MAYKPQKPGEQNPGKYPFTGQNYANWGEQAGFIYDPYRDAYMPDRSAAQNYYQSQGLVKPDVPGSDTVKSPNGHTYSWQNGQWVDTTPKQPGLIDSVVPIGTAALAVEGGKQVASGIGSGFSSGGLFSSGASGATTGGTTAAGSSGGAGLIGGSGGATGSGAVGSGAASGGGAAGSSASGAGAFSEGVSATGSGASQAVTGASSTFPGGFGVLPAAGIVAGGITGINQAQGAREVLKGGDLTWQQQAALALPTFGLSFLYNPLKRTFGFGDQDRWKTEQTKLKKLEKDGVYVPDGLTALNLKGAQGKNAGFRNELAPDFIGRDSEGNWVNNKFAKSRNVADLRPEDIVNYAAFAEKDPDWFKKPLDQRLQVADQALRAGAVSEGKGSIKVDWKKVGDTPQSPPPQGNQGRPAQPINQGSPGMRPRNQGRPSQPMRP